MEDSVNVLKFAECRAREVMTLMEEVTMKEPKLTLQKLPFHMRRRAASHNPKRLPKRVRAKLPDEPLAKHKKKARNHKNLLEEYNSRQGSDTWLPTHIWFAKRFHMKRMWGYQLPFQATGKRFRSSYRATVRNSLIQDLTYFCCIELKGDQDKLLSRLSCLTDESVGMNFASESCIDGTKEGQCFLYQPNSFPFNGIGPVSFLWKPFEDTLTADSGSSTPSSQRQLWVWCHPSISDELVKVFIDVFHLQENLGKSAKEYTFASHVNETKCKLHFQKEPVYCGDAVTMCVLKDTLVRHRIVGPNATSVLTSVLKSAESTEEHLATFLGKQGAWNYLTMNPQLTYSIPMISVIGLRVDDPRLYVTSKREGVLLEDDVLFRDDVIEEFSKPAMAFSELWNMDMRNEATASQVPEHVINQERGKYVIPDASCLRKCTTSVPVIVIHQPGDNGYACGWDIIAPQGWGMAFWIPFIHHGAQPAGFDDFCGTNLESGTPTFPLSFPDTKAGSIYEEKTREERLKKFYRYPRAKRPNFKLFGVPSPFFMPWSALVSDWEKEFLKKYDSSGSILSVCDNTRYFFTLRNRKEIMNIQNFCVSFKKMPKEKLIDGHNALVQRTLASQNICLKAVLLVRVKSLFRGLPTGCSGIYLPVESDFENLRENPKHFGPVETKHSLNTELSGMPAKKRRKILKEEAKQESKNLDRPNVETVITCSERRVIGYVSEGGYSRLGSQGYGVGHCSMTGFLTLLELCMPFTFGAVVLIREQHTNQYRYANIEILNNPF